MPQFTIEKMQTIWLDYETIQLIVASIKQTTITAWNQSKQNLKPSYVGRGRSFVSQLLKPKKITQKLY